MPRADGMGRVLAIGTLTNTPAVANVIREAKTLHVPGHYPNRKETRHAVDG